MFSFRSRADSSAGVFLQVQENELLNTGLLAQADLVLVVAFPFIKCGLRMSFVFQEEVILPAPKATYEVCFP